MKIPEIKNSLFEFIKRCKRVIFVAKKPSKEEFKQACKITGIGMAILGIIGFIIFLIFNLLISGI
jgi:protein transport protein SEC61 subunit gamma-like protein